MITGPKVAEVPPGAKAITTGIGPAPLGTQARVRTHNGTTTVAPLAVEVDYAGPKDRPDKWWKARDFDDYDPRFDELVQDSTRRRREDDRQQEGRHTRQRGRGLDDPKLYFPCEECMALAGTNTSCNVCHYKYATHFDNLKKAQSLPNLAKSSQPKLPRFPCPFPMNAEAELCDGGQAPSFYGHAPECLVSPIWVGKIQLSWCKTLFLGGSSFVNPMHWQWKRHGIPKEWDTSCIKQLCHSLFSDQHEYLFEQSVDHLCDAIFRDEDLWAIFAGYAPWTNDTLKKLASSGSWYFNLVYYQITALYKCQTTKKHDLPAPNDQFVMFYDAMVDHLPRHHPLVDDKEQLLSRHWNNKGNGSYATHSGNRSA